MSAHPLVEAFYSRIWNSGDEQIDTLLTEDFSFRGSLGAETRGRAAFLEYVRSVRGSLADYRCEILTCVVELPRAFARMRFSGVHFAQFRGFAPTGRRVHWEGAALFTFRENAICDLWVLGDLVGLDEQLRAQWMDEQRDQPRLVLSRFAFLVGRWRCEARVKRTDGEWQALHATWVGRYILDGRAIADEYRMTGPDGETIVLGVNLRAYDPVRKVWNMKWLNALAGTWIDLGPEELGGVKFQDDSIVYVFREPVADHAFTRATYTNVSADRFTWRGEKSDDGRVWSEFMVAEAYRVEP